MSSGSAVCRPAFDFVKGVARTVGGGACLREGPEVLCGQAAMDRLQDFYSGHFQNCRYEGDEGAYEAAFAGEISTFVQQLRARQEAEDAERAWQAPNVS
eukprot:9717455-Alexandrium_andersonii.AAC.1